MNKREWRKEHNDIIREIASWCGQKPKKPFPQREVGRREFIFYKQVVLYEIADAKKKKYKLAETFYTKLFYVISAYAKALADKKRNYAKIPL